MKKIIVTGATSMIGIALIKAALADRFIEKIYAVVRPDSSKVGRLPDDERIKLIFCDVVEYEKLPSMIADSSDVFYHLAWPRTATYHENYEDILKKTRNLQTVLEAVNAAVRTGCKKFVGAGSQSEYGIVKDGKMSPETLCSPVRADGVLHLAAGRMAAILAENLGISCIWMRIFSVYGIYDRQNSMIMTTTRKLLDGEHCSFTPCEQMWDYLYEDDIGRAFYLVGKKITGGHVYCVGSGEARSLRSYIEEIRDIVSPETDLGFGELSYPKDPVMNLCADNSSLREDTGWKPETKFSDGIRAILEFQS